MILSIAHPKFAVHRSIYQLQPKKMKLLSKSWTRQIQERHIKLNEPKEVKK